MPLLENSKSVLEFYSTDESIFKITPKFFSSPKTTEEISEVLKFASQNSLTVTAVGSKTSVAGQGLGNGIILDISKNFKKILFLHENKVTLEPGVVLDDLNELLAIENKIFPPDPASSKFCSIGGMIANNSSGARAMRYGMTKDYVESLKVVLSDGSIWNTGFPQKTNSLLQEKILAEFPKILKQNENLIRSKIPNSAKNSCGYDLIGCLENPEKMFTRIFVGSEGTLGIVTEAILKVVEKPKANTVILFYFDDLEKMAQSVKLLREFKNISAAELLDKTFLNFIKSQVKQNFPNFSEETQALLIVEVTNSEKSKLNLEVKRITEFLAKSRLSYFSKIARNEKEKTRIWALRKSASPLLKERTDSLKSVRVIEDTAVNPEILPKYLLGLRKIFAELEITAVIFGHAGDGNVHINPLLDPAKPNFREFLLQLADRTYTWVLECGGTISGEHGDGILRSGYVRQQFGELFPVFEEVKKLFDPKGILNNGKIIGKETALKNVEFKF